MSNQDEESTISTTGATIREHRVKAGKSLLQLAEEIPFMSTARLGEIERGERPFPANCAAYLYRAIPSLAPNAEPEGRKDDQGKRRYGLIPHGALGALADVLTFGAKKYAPENWRKVANWRERYYDATIRHLEAWRAGEYLDPETGLPHLAHALACLVFLYELDGPRVIGVDIAYPPKVREDHRAETVRDAKDGSGVSVSFHASPAQAWKSAQDEIERLKEENAVFRKAAEDRRQENGHLRDRIEKLEGVELKRFTRWWHEPAGALETARKERDALLKENAEILEKLRVWREGAQGPTLPENRETEPGEPTATSPGWCSTHGLWCSTPGCDLDYPHKPFACKGQSPPKPKPSPGEPASTVCVLPWRACTCPECKKHNPPPKPKPAPRECPIRRCDACDEEVHKDDAFKNDSGFFCDEDCAEDCAKA